jgi:hypothetical protein
MKKVIITSVIALFSLTAMAQDRKVAVFDPAGNVDNNTKEMVREEIISILVNTRGYMVLERQLIDKALEENRFQAGALFDETKAGEIGIKLGADKVFVTNITTMGNNNLYISCKMIDMSTMSMHIEMQKSAQTQRGTGDLISVIQKLVREMLADVAVNENMLTVEGRRVYQKGVKLDKYEVRSLMANTDALRVYNKGQSRNTTGNVLLITGVALIAGGAYIAAAQPLDSRYTENGLRVYSYSDGIDYRDNNIYYHYDDERNLGYGVAFIGAGVVATVTGMIIKATGKSPIKKSVNMYNSGTGRTTSMNVKVGFTGNRVGLTLNF